MIIRRLRTQNSRRRRNDQGVRPLARLLAQELSQDEIDKVNAESPARSGPASGVDGDCKPYRSLSSWLQARVEEYFRRLR